MPAENFDLDFSLYFLSLVHGILFIWCVSCMCYHVTRLHQPEGGCLSNSETFNLNIFYGFHLSLDSAGSCQEENIEVLRDEFYLSLHKFEE